MELPLFYFLAFCRLNEQIDTISLMKLQLVMQNMNVNVAGKFDERVLTY